jgi:hypothetical protein
VSSPHRTPASAGISSLFITTDGHISGPPHVIECEDDQEAIGKAVQYTNGKSVELWNGARFVVRFPKDET